MFGIFSAMKRNPCNLSVFYTRNMSYYVKTRKGYFKEIYKFLFHLLIEGSVPLRRQIPDLGPSALLRLDRLGMGIWGPPFPHFDSTVFTSGTDPWSDGRNK